MSHLKLTYRSVIPLAQKPIRPPAKRRYGKLKEAAAYLNVSERTIRQMIADGRLTGYKGGNRLIRVDLDEVEAVLQPFGGAA